MSGDSCELRIFDEMPSGKGTTGLSEQQLRGSRSQSAMSRSVVFPKLGAALQ
jgi:hypothetical protein